jgi:hypothetical protein
METVIIPGLDIWLIVKILALILLSLYLVFALVVVRQVKLMTDTLNLGYEGFVKFLSLVHLAFAVLVFLAAFVIL